VSDAVSAMPTSIRTTSAVADVDQRPDRRISAPDCSPPPSRISGRRPRADGRLVEVAEPPAPHPDPEEVIPTFTEIAEARCLELLQSQTVGRVAWFARDAPEILPVNYVWHENCVIFRTSAHGPLSELSQPTDVAFEVDEIDQQHHQGWSVVVHGRAEGVVRPADVVRLFAASGVPWASGMRILIIRITPTRVSGRLVATQSNA